MSDTCSPFPPFGDPWPSYLLPSQGHRFNKTARNSLVVKWLRLLAEGLSWIPGQETKVSQATWPKKKKKKKIFGTICTL